MNDPTVTVVVCVRNRPRQVLACLQSLVAQDHPSFEIVAVDDASTDETPARLTDFAARHPEVALRIVRNRQNLGVSGARNAGIATARGAAVAFTDSDCVVESSWLSELVTPLDAPDVSAVSGVVFDQVPDNLAERAYHGTCQIGRAPLQGRALVGNNMAIRRDLLQRYPFDEALNYYCDEDDLAARLQADGHRIEFAHRAVARHHHRLDLAGFLRLTIRQGIGSARYWYKHNIWIGRDLLPLTAALATLPLLLLDRRLGWVPTLLLGLQALALIYNEMAFKGKSGWETVRVLPLCLLCCLVRAQSVYRTLLKILLGGETAIRLSKRRLASTR